MIPLVLLVVGLGLVVGGWLVLRSLGPRVRVGRLLAATPKTTVADAIALAEAGTTRYVRVDGRLDSEQEFEDRDHRPLVLRRTRLQARDGTAWRTFDERREQVPFELREGLDAIAIDVAALDDGLVVVPRESEGVASDLGDEAPADLAPTTPVRARIEQVSSVEHAIALGVPVRDGAGVKLTAGMGRPLVLTTVEPPDAMRILTEGRTSTPRTAAVLLVGGLAIGAAGLLALVVDALT